MSLEFHHLEFCNGNLSSQVSIFFIQLLSIRNLERNRLPPMNTDKELIKSDKNDLNSGENVRLTNHRIIYR